jgi:fatty-acyl-CoA synthase
MTAPAYDWIRHHARATPDKLAAVDLHSGRRWTYREMDGRCDRLAAFLRDEAGVGCGDRVVVLMHNSTDMFEVQFAMPRLGAVYVPISWRLSPAEIGAIVADAEPTALIYGPECAGIAAALGRARPALRLIDVADGDDSMYERGLAVDRAPPQPPPLSHDDLWTVMYTSGTTGCPKGAEITYGMVFFSSVNGMMKAGVTADSVGLTFLPLFHVGGLYLFATFIFHCGGTNHLMRTFDATRALGLLSDRSLGVTHVFGVPTNFLFMTQLEAWAEADLSSVSGLFVGGAPCPLSVLRAFGRKGTGIRQAWGMTETTTLGTVLDASQAFDKSGSSGKPVLHAELRVVDADMNDVPAGEVGQLVIRGPTVTQGYWRSPDETARAFRDGWFLTGDAASVDRDGCYYIVDRWKDMYISGGENVYPAEIENALHQHPEVVEAAVIGVSDTRWGEVGMAFVVRRLDATIDESTLLAHCAERLARFKLPRTVRFVDDLPHTAAGKIAKPVLRKLAANERSGP